MISRRGVDDLKPLQLSLYRYQGVVYRAHNPQWAFSPTSGQGAASNGGRFNKKGVPALYTATTSMGAVIEGAQNMMGRLQPLTIVSYQVDHETVLDLSTEKARRSAGIELHDLACEWAYLAAKGQAVPSWSVAEIVRLKGAGAILVPSFAKGAPTDATNLVFFQWDANRPSQVKVVDDHQRLPRNQRSWQ